MQASGVTPAPRDERLLNYLERVRHVSLEVVGPDCASIVEAYYLKARAAVQGDQGLQAVQEAIAQMVREIAKLKDRTWSGPYWTNSSALRHRRNVPRTGRFKVSEPAEGPNDPEEVPQADLFPCV